MYRLSHCGLMAACLLLGACTDRPTAPSGSPELTAIPTAELSAASSTWQLVQTYATSTAKRGAWAYYDIAASRFAAPHEYAVNLIELSGNAGLYVESFNSSMTDRKLIAAPMMNGSTDVSVKVDQAMLIGRALVRVWVYGFADSRFYVTTTRRLAAIQWPLGGSFNRSMLLSYRFGTLWAPGECPSRALKRHTGVDYRASKNSPVYAPMDGIVRQSHLDGKWRYGVVVEDLTKSFTVVFWHMEPTVRVNDAVRAGQRIGSVADMGSNTHFHFGYRRGPYTPTSLHGALPQSNCGGYPAFPEQFVSPETDVRFK